MSFEFATAGRIIFGADTVRQAGKLAAAMGGRALLVTGQSAGRAAPLMSDLSTQGMDVATFAVSGEPTIDVVSQGVAVARDGSCEVVIGLGGGSVLDTAKAIAALLTNGGEPLDYVEVIGRGKPIDHPAAPMIAIPTTAGTGSEVTRNAVLGSPEHRVKVSLRSPLMLPRLAVVDPRLTYGLPRRLTATTGLDALTQVLEPFVSSQANPLTDAICREALRRAGRSLPRVCADGDDVVAREDMMLVSLFGGLALANAKLGAVHGIAGPLGGMFPAPHGAVCAALLPHVMAVNVRAAKQQDRAGATLSRYDEVARNLVGDEHATAADGIDWIHRLCRREEIPALGSYGLEKSDLPGLVEKALRASSMKGNPIALSDAELEEVLERSM